jgi:hypothetical protein
MLRVISPGALSLVLAIVFSLAPSRAPLGGSIGEVIDCALSSLPPSVHGKFELKSRSAKGSERMVHGEYWAEQPQDSGRRVVVASRGGANMARAAYLFREGDTIGEVWLWTPDHGDARRIQARGDEGRLFGTDVTLEDFARFARINFPGQLRRLDDAAVAGRPVYVVETRPAPDIGSEYGRILSSVDKEWCVILRRESFDTEFEGGSRPRKILSVDPKDVKHEKGFARATSALLQDLRDGSQTTVQLEDLSLDEKLPAGFFTPENLAETAK